MFKDIEYAAGEPTKQYGMPLFIDLFTDMKEEFPTDDHRWIENAWVRWPAGQVLTDHLKSLQEEPPIPAGTLDPYKPSK